MVADVQSWLDNPASNFAWLVKGNEATAGNRPALIVDFTPPDVPTESATWGRVKAESR